MNYRSEKALKLTAPRPSHNITSHHNMSTCETKSNYLGTKAEEYILPGWHLHWGNAGGGGEDNAPTEGPEGSESQSAAVSQRENEDEDYGG